MESVIAEKYAVALLQVAQEQKTVDAIAAEIQAIQKAVETHPDLKTSLEHPRAKAQEKLEALRRNMSQKAVLHHGKFPDAPHHEKAYQALQGRSGALREALL